MECQVPELALFKFASPLELAAPCAPVDGTAGAAPQSHGLVLVIVAAGRGVD